MIDSKNPDFIVSIQPAPIACSKNSTLFKDINNSNGIKIITLYQWPHTSLQTPIFFHIGYHYLHSAKYFLEL